MFVAQLYEVSVQGMKAYVGRSCLSPLISNLGASWSRLHHFHGRNPPITAARRLGGPQRQYGRFGEWKNSLSLLGFKPELSGP
jgi:hypothetical protein